mmetsp:Transcript_35738/g.54965  ORF Transcript_35738/g.54965 Transcript_35738/m.54965 type:complete len:207 (-) Transcript_35738:391-1011(-)|eukprot:CAMPEP_0118688414 /NCGR_PEP_ID=MMETSP0800-20121206/8908_1 /TAXON_ID=210618 ORGANISM="Striatella unipunctata, Strain CCMP2910" /NCGR_SAMPLE_ID=MMETSP0800 /ASSEMBLY_ACC=CAM_ASM_000638 /LENGTH=206 /DNA_ID=CAMNT_0006585673 /DNA_START=109 /DNA_END=729 /DNA_ORIENTATION=-
MEYGGAELRELFPVRRLERHFDYDMDVDSLCDDFDSELDQMENWNIPPPILSNNSGPLPMTSLRMQPKIVAQVSLSSCDESVPRRKGTARDVDQALQRVDLSRKPLTLNDFDFDDDEMDMPEPPVRMFSFDMALPEPPTFPSRAVSDDVSVESSDDWSSSSDSSFGVAPEVARLQQQIEQQQRRNQKLARMRSMLNPSNHAAVILP